MGRLGYDSVDNKIFTIEFMEDLIIKHAREKGYSQVKYAMDFAKEKHSGQYRRSKNSNGVPYPYYHHPLRVAVHSILLGFDSEEMIMTALLHDVCEDCDVTVEELQVSKEVKDAVCVLTKSSDIKISDPDYTKYFKNISDNNIATIIKLLDRCSNVTDMAEGFKDERIKKYIRETENKIYPLFDSAKEKYPNKRYAVLNLEYHIKGIIEAIKAL